MSAASESSSEFSSSSESPSEDESVLAHPCRWGWCRELLPTKEALISHVIEHTKRVVPVRRKDVALMRRIEEGTQPSLRVSLIKDSLPRSTATAGSSQEVHDNSLPSPPHSSAMLCTPALHSRALPQDGPSSSSGSSSSGSEGGQNKSYASPGEAHPGGSVAASPNSLGQRPGTARHITPTFASLNSPTNSLASQASRAIPHSTPNSPTFSSLVKRKQEVDHLPQPSRLNPSSMSRSSTGSTGSQISVEKQLTQSPRNDAASEASMSPHRENIISNGFPSPGLDGDVTMSQNLYAAELAWDRGEGTSDVFLSQQPSQAVEFELLTQPPSQLQLQLGSFPFHNHRKSRNVGASQVEPASSMPFRPSPPVPITEKTFAVSTPQPQPARRQTRSQSRGPEPSPVQTRIPGTPIKRTTSVKPTPTTKTPKTTKPRSRSFRSGTLQITPLAQSKPSTITEETSQQLRQGLTAEELLNIHNPLHHFNGSPGQSQSSFESMDFAELQTQAPYDSQPTTQY